MRKKIGLLLLIICILMLHQASFAQSQIKLPCICLDENGVKYPENALDTVLCYTCTEENGCVLNGLTKTKCALLNLSLTPTPEPQKEEPTSNNSSAKPVQEAPVTNTSTEPVHEAPVTNTYTEPVYEAPVTNTYTEPVYEAPVTNTYTEPVYEAPVTNTYTEPVYEAPVTNTYTEPVYEAPVTNTYTEPVYEVPVTNTYTEPVYEAPVTNTYTEPVYEAPVTNTYTEPVYEAPVTNTYTEPVYEAPVTNTYTEPVYEQPVTNTYTEPVYEQPVMNTYTEPVYEQPVTNTYTEPVFDAAVTDLSRSDNGFDPDKDSAFADGYYASFSDDPSVDIDSEPIYEGFPEENTENPLFIQPLFQSSSINEDPVNSVSDTAADPNEEEVPLLIPNFGTFSSETDPDDSTPSFVTDIIESETITEPDGNNNKTESGVPSEQGNNNDVNSEDGNTETIVIPDFSATEPEPDNNTEEDPEQTPEPNTDESEVTTTPEPSSTPDENLPTEEPSPTPDENLPTKEPDEPAPMLRKGVSIEGKLDKLGLSSPDGETLTDPAVTFTWVYLVTGSGSTDVEFTLSLTILDKETNQTNTANITLEDTAVCADFICQYTAGAELSGYKKADVTWTVSGKPAGGDDSETVYPENPAVKTFSLDVQDAPTPEPTVTPVPKPKAPVLECPTGNYGTRSIGFYWAPSENAETYTVTWKDDKNHSGTIKLSNSDTTCQKGRCIAYATMPGTGNYTWYVTAKNDSGSAKSKSMNFTIKTNISTPTAYRPNGTIINRYYPAFEWEDVQDGVTEYRIQVIGKYDNLIRLDSWFKVKDIYVGKGICYVKTNLFLPAGTYSWRVQGKNNEFTSNWSAWRDFYVECDYCYTGTTTPVTYTNTVLSLSYPTGTINNRTPDFQWRTLTGASYYQVTLTNASGQQLLSTQVTAAANCTAELCTWKPGYKLPANGNYSWTVSGYGGNGTRWATTSAGFMLQAVVEMNPMSFTSPSQNGWLSAESPRIIWTDPGATTALFSLQIYDKSGKTRFSAELNREQAWCDGITCSIEFRTIPDAEGYRIAVTQYSDLNTKGQTIELTFSKGSKPIKLISPKADSAVPSRPMFRWALEAGAEAQYELTLTDENNVVTRISPLVCGQEGVTCEDGEAFFSPATPLHSGTYTASVSTVIPGYTGEILRFRVN